MNEPAVNSYEIFLDVDAREEIGTVNLKEKGTIIGFYVQEWEAYNKSTDERTWNS